MGINHLQLSPELIAALYPETLVAGKDGYPYLGENRRSISFLMNYPDHAFLPDEQLVFLEKMLSACKCNLEDIAILNTATHPVQFTPFIKQMHPGIIFFWGIRSESVGLVTHLKDFDITPLGDISVISVPTPDIMSGNSPEGLELKQRLWACLKKLFNL
jgi:hypothetical protein